MVYKGSSLIHTFAQHAAQRVVDHVSGRVVAHDCGTTLAVHVQLNQITHGKGSALLGKVSNVEYVSAKGLNVVDAEGWLKMVKKKKVGKNRLANFISASLPPSHDIRFVVQLNLHNQYRESVLLAQRRSLSCPTPNRGSSWHSLKLPRQKSNITSLVISCCSNINRNTPCRSK